MYSELNQRHLIKTIKEMLSDFDDHGLIYLGNAIDEEVSKRFQLHDEKKKEEALEAKAILKRVK